MVLGMLARLSSNVCCFLYPAYASYKALSMTPESSPEAMAQVEKWLMYWSVVGTWTAVEAAVGWTFTWLPFYSVIKAVVFIYLSSPQSGGSSWIYRTQLAPFFRDHETDIDGFLTSLKGRAGTAVSEAIQWAWNKAKTQLNVSPNSENTGSHQPAVPTHQPPSMQDPASGPALQLYGLLSRYAGQYLPVALSALQAAAASNRSRQDRDSTPVAMQVPESMAMPTPRVNQADHTGSLRSRTYQQASAPQSQSGSHDPRDDHNSSWSRSPLPTPPSFGNSQFPGGSPHRPGMSLPGSRDGSDGLSAHSSQESLGRASASTSASRFGGESYEHVNRDEVRNISQSEFGQGTPTGRPAMTDKRRGSWFGWGGASPNQGRAKAE
ncbi:TB2/DP1, HVA22 family-domain-containing protein [Kockovaella imperatae]|uniref:Protein YOP1 n=1 Tax=Kockovaella imperatae TaxID=4999 RepID=A0A1Y1ULC8_9TREE|nr:TB2/DP1, HVA22 family-domain-containing protein [Kockovaella imperatae]ORX37915.1 TB2/DP1, HVA22 family-domain-containing protein [Kockovaella imperatae]